jgi:ribose transport system ATP-binding protein
VFRTLQRLKQQAVGMIFVTHRLDEVFRIADRVSVMRDGRRVFATTTGEADLESLVRAIVGRPPDEMFVHDSTHALGAVVAEFNNVVAGAAGPCSFAARAGEVVALVGLEGAGQSDIGRVLIGDVPLESGEIRLEGAPYDRPNARLAIDLGVGFVSAKRGEESLAINRSVRENLFINPAIPNRALRGWINPADERRDARALMTRFHVRAPDPETSMAALSGGNQQKVALARWLGASRKLLILEEPTAGVDVGAKAEIYRLFDVALQAGAAILIVSNDFEEVAKVCHRASVFSRGRVVAELVGADLSVENLLAEASANIRHSAEAAAAAFVNQAQGAHAVD